MGFADAFLFLSKICLQSFKQILVCIEYLKNVLLFYHDNFIIGGSALSIIKSFLLIQNDLYLAYRLSNTSNDRSNSILLKLYRLYCIIGSRIVKINSVDFLLANLFNSSNFLLYVGSQSVLLIILHKLCKLKLSFLDKVNLLWDGILLVQILLVVESSFLIKLSQVHNIYEFELL